MKRAVFKILIFALSLSVFAQKSLILVPDAGMLRYELPVLQEVEGACIVLADLQQLDQLKTRKVSYSTLDQNTEGKEYFLVTVFADDPADEVTYSRNVFEKYGMVLATFSDCVLMETNATELNTMYEYHIEFIALGREPIDFTCRTIVDTKPIPAPYNPLLQEILDRVREDSCENHLRELCSHYNRDIRGDYNKNDVIPYLKKKYLAYGCDSIIELPISYGNTEVVGVRFGKKDPTINKFVLVGGHSDTKGVGATERHQGANDNASGQVGVLEAARVHQYYDFDYTLLYASHNGEEYGLLGAKALVKALKNVNARVVGGVFSYDMLGVRGSSIYYQAYEGNTGAKEFVDRVDDLVNTYQPYNVTDVSTTTSSSKSTDVTAYWNNGYVCMWHKWGSGFGSIHTFGDSIGGNFNPQHLTGTTKTGILGSAYYANPRGPTSIQSKPVRRNAPAIMWKQTASGNIAFDLDIDKISSHATLEIFDLHGRLINSFNLAEARSGKATLVWDRRSNSGVKVGNSLLIVRFKDTHTKSETKLVIK